MAHKSYVMINKHLLKNVSENYWVPPFTKYLAPKIQMLFREKGAPVPIPGTLLSLQVLAIG